MTKCEQYLDLLIQASRLRGEESDAMCDKAIAIRDTFTKEDWEELIAQSSGRAKCEYKRMMNAKFPPQSEDGVMIKDETHFTECTDEQKEWAKQFDASGTKYYEMIWNNPKKYSVALSDPIWREGRWEDVEW